MCVVSPFSSNTAFPETVWNAMIILSKMLAINIISQYKVQWILHKKAIWVDVFGKILVVVYINKYKSKKNRQKFSPHYTKLTDQISFTHTISSWWLIDFMPILPTIRQCPIYHPRWILILWHWRNQSWFPSLINHRIMIFYWKDALN